MRTERKEALGYRRERRTYEVGSPGYWVEITRLADGAVMYSGPYSDPEQEVIHPDWAATDRETRRRIRRALDESPPPEQLEVEHE